MYGWRGSSPCAQLKTTGLARCVYAAPVLRSSQDASCASGAAPSLDGTQRDSQRLTTLAVLVVRASLRTVSVSHTQRNFWVLASPHQDHLCLVCPSGLRLRATTRDPPVRFLVPLPGSAAAQLCALQTSLTWESEQIESNAPWRRHSEYVGKNEEIKEPPRVGRQVDRRPCVVRCGCDDWCCRDGCKPAGVGHQRRGGRHGASVRRSCRSKPPSRGWRWARGGAGPVLLLHGLPDAERLFRWVLVCASNWLAK